MALILTSTEEKKIFITGTNIEVSSTYLRLEFVCRANGRTIEIFSAPYQDKAAYLSQNSISVDIPLNSIISDIDTLTQIQSVEVIHNIAKTHFENKGYSVALDL